MAIVLGVSRRKSGGFLVLLDCKHTLEENESAQAQVGEQRVDVIFGLDYNLECPHCGNDVLGDEMSARGFERGMQLAIEHKFKSAKEAREFIKSWLKTAAPDVDVTKAQRLRWNSGVHTGFWKGLEREPWHKSNAQK
jgi:hypothetical protein